jgi:hypothetical protein
VLFEIRGSNPKKIEFRIGFGWKTLPPKISKISYTQAQKNPKIHEIQNLNPNPKSDLFWILKFKIHLNLSFLIFQHIFFKKS